MKKILGTFIVAAILLVVLLYTARIWQQESLRFSNTQTWDVTAYPIPNDAQVIAFDTSWLPPPPSNTSTTTQAELAYLHTLVEKRTPEALAYIRDELYFSTTPIGSTTLGDIFATKPHTKRAFDYLIGVTDPALLAAKRHFDRVRPSYLDPSLSTAIPVPSHPAYPSGHATEARLTAYFLSELDPTNRAVYFKDADRTAYHREVAGVHYPSDTTAGKMLADQLYQAIQADEQYRTLLHAATIEW